MLSKEILDAVKTYTAAMQKTVTFVIQHGEHEKRAELITFLSSLCSVSEQLKLEERDTNGLLRSPISFYLAVDGNDSGIHFSGIPSGHEFNSLVLAVLQAAGSEIKLDPQLKKALSGIQDKLDFEVFVSLSCHNCPDVVQALNQIALLNSNIQVETIDGGLFQTLITERDIQGVPSVYLNGEVFINGKVDSAQIIEKLLAYADTNEVNDDQITGELQDVTIIGGGPAGVSAAIYSARKGLKVTLIAERFGGQVKDTMAIENLISVSKTTGSELSAALLGHLNDYDVTLKEHVKVTGIEQSDIKSITLSTGETIHSKTIVIATGAKWRELGIPGEKENIGNGVAFCPHCDGPFFKGKEVAVIGGGNSGIEAALDLAGIVKSVSVLEFLPQLKADQVLIEQAEKKTNITIYKNVATQRITAQQGKVNALEYVDRATQITHSLPLDGVFVQIGLLPNSDFVKDIVTRNQFGEIIVDEHCQTSAPGIYACGDVTTVPHKQIVVAMGEGAKAALGAFDYLLTNGERLEGVYQSIVNAASALDNFQQAV